MSAKPERKDPKIPATVPFGVLEDSLHMMKCGTDTLDQLAALFQAIRDKVMDDDPNRDSVGDHHQIRALASLGKDVAMDMAEHLGSDCERTLRNLGVAA